ncbi:hypothetical protein JCM8547_005919 [Rhodosporidiobolus lusitaniae]
MVSTPARSASASSPSSSGSSSAPSSASPFRKRYYQRQVVKGKGFAPPSRGEPASDDVSGIRFGAGILFGVALVGIYVSSNIYLAVAFSEYSASAMAAKTLARSLAGASVPMCIGPMYASIGNLWAGMTFAFIALAMCLIPFVFFGYDAAIRSRSTMVA